MLDFSIFSYPGNTGNLIFLVSHILETLQNGFSLFSHILEILEIEVCNILYNLEIRAAGGRRRAGGSRGCVVLPWIIFGTCFLEFPDILEIFQIIFLYIKPDFLIFFFKKD